MASTGDVLSGRGPAQQPALRGGVSAGAIKAVPVRHPWRWVFALALLALGALFIVQLATAPALKWDVVLYWLTQGTILKGILVTIELTAIAMAIGVSLGTLVAVMRLSSNPVMSAVSWFYIWLFRGTPVLVQLVFWYYLHLVLKTLSFGIPFTPLMWHGDTLNIITPFAAAILGLGLNEAAYMAEIVRAGIISVDHGQTEAAQALGMNRVLVMARVVLPQAMRVIIPPTGNETISMLKTTSLVFIVTVQELFETQNLIAAYNYKVIELLIVASIWYLVATSLLTAGQYYVERHFARGGVRQLPPTPLQRFRRVLVQGHAPPPWPAADAAPVPPSIPGRR